MGYALPDGVSFCETQGRFVFLDLGRDRYWCLAGPSAEGFRSLVEGEPITSIVQQKLEQTADSGLLLRTWDSLRPSPCRQEAPPLSSLIDITGVRPRARLVMHSLARVGLARTMLRIRGLRAVLSALRRRKAKAATAGWREPEALGAIAAAFRLGGRIAAPLDQCLPRSIATAHMLIDRKIEPELVIGVRLRPFGAHCWVQAGSSLVNESLDQARNFTPILVV